MNKNNLPENQSNFLPCTGNKGKVNDEVFFQDETIWLTQKAIVKLFEKSKTLINDHLSNIFNICDFDENSVVRNFRTVQTEGLRQIVAQNTLILKHPIGERRGAV